MTDESLAVISFELAVIMLVCAWIAIQLTAILSRLGDRTSPKVVADADARPAPAQPAAVEEQVELVQLRAGEWESHSWRPEGHSDVHAVRAGQVAGFRIRKNGVLEG
jgi:hypothetical protein